MLTTISNWRDQDFHPPSSIGFGNYYRASFFGKHGKKGTEGFSKVCPSLGNIAGISAIVTSCRLFPFSHSPEKTLIATHMNFPSFAFGLHPLPFWLYPLLPRPIPLTVPPSGLLPQRASSSSILMGPLREILDLQAMELSFATIMGTSFSSVWAP
jgi:hypothetical protein